MIPPDVPLQEHESLPVHVAACAARYRGIDQRLKRVERVAWALLGVVAANGAGFTPALGAAVRALLGL